MITPPSLLSQYHTHYLLAILSINEVLIRLLLSWLVQNHK